MGRLDPFTDLTGKMSQSDLNAQDISNIIDEINKIQDAQTGHIQQTNLATIINDGTTNRILNGYQSVLDQWGLFVSKAGVDVTKATVDQLIFNSNQDIFKITKKVPISLSITTPGSYFGQTSIAHGLDYVPSFVTNHTFSNSLQALGSFTDTTNHSNPAFVYGTVGATLALLAICEVTVDINNIYLAMQLSPGVPNGTYSVNSTVYLEQETFS